MRELNTLENTCNIADKLLKGLDRVYYIFRNNKFEQVAVDIPVMQGIIDKFIETRSEAIKDATQSAKAEDVK